MKLKFAAFKPAAEAKKPKRMSGLDEHTALAYARLQELKTIVGEDAPSVKNIELIDLRKSHDLRNKILNFTLQHFAENPTPAGSFKKKYSSKKQQYIDQHQQVAQSQAASLINEAAEVARDNKVMHEEYMKGEEGVDHEYLIPGEKEKMDFNVKKFEREVRLELQACKNDPLQKQRADELEHFVLADNTWADEALGSAPIPEDEIAFYPGSDKVPEPEDDPESYSRWFFDNQPKSLYKDQAVPTYTDIGVKQKFIKMVKDDNDLNEYKSATDYFFKYDEMYPMQDYEGGPPEWALFEKANFA